MRIRHAVTAAALFLIVSFAWPSVSEAGHRHSRSCGHGWSVYDSYRAPHFRTHDYRYNGTYPYGYGWGYRPPVHYAPPPVYYAPPPVYYGAPPVYVPYGYSYGYPYTYAPPLVSLHYHGRLACRRPHVSVRLGF